MAETTEETTAEIEEMTEETPEETIAEIEEEIEATLIKERLVNL